MSFTKEEIEKLSEKNSFLIQKSFYFDLQNMGEIETKTVINAIFEYVLYGQIPSFNEPKYRFIKSVFDRFKDSYDKDSKKWLKSCEKKSENKKEDWQKKKGDKVDKFGNPLEHPIYH